MKETWYVVECYQLYPYDWNKVRKVLVDKETKLSLYINYRWRKKKSKDFNYFKTFKEAKRFLANKYKAEYKASLAKLNKAKEALDHIKAIKPF